MKDLKSKYICIYSYKTKASHKMCSGSSSPSLMFRMWGFINSNYQGYCPGTQGIVWCLCAAHSGRLIWACHCPRCPCILREDTVVQSRCCTKHPWEHLGQPSRPCPGVWSEADDTLEIKKIKKNHAFGPGGLVQKPGLASLWLQQPKWLLPGRDLKSLFLF